jgi:hypothetical protein
MKPFQKLLVLVTIVATGVAIHQGWQSAALRRKIVTVQQQYAVLLAEFQQLGGEYQNATNRLASFQRAASPGNQDREILKLRGEVTRLRTAAQDQVHIPNGPEGEQMKASLARVSTLKRRLEQMPERKIPEMQWLTGSDWVEAVNGTGDLETEAEARRALGGLRHLGKKRFVPMAQAAFQAYANANDGQLPKALSDLKPFFDPPIDEAVLDRYTLLRSGALKDLPADPGGVKLIAEKAPVDPDYDVHYEIGLNSWSTTGVNPFWMNDAPAAMEAYKRAHQGQPPAQPSELVPFFNRPVEVNSLGRLFR